jgi:hypothetical protein
MDPIEFQGWLNKMGGVQSLPSPPQNVFWEEVICAIEPHYNGDMPVAVIDAFPNETTQQHAYRCKAHRSLTKPKLWQAIADVKRALLGDNYGVELGEGMANFLDVERFGEERVNLSSYVWDVVYPRRVLDPNGLLAVIPLPSVDPTQPVGIKLRIFASKDIRFVSKEMGMVMVEDRQNTKYKTTYHIFTPTNILILFLNKESKWVVEEWYKHNNNDLGLCVLGGKMVMRERYGRDYHIFDSDFGACVPAMDTLEVLQNQLASSTLNTVFPLRVVKGLECLVCEGVGYEEYREPVEGEIKDIHHHYPYTYDEFTGTSHKIIRNECNQCKGKGVLHLSPLDGILIAPPTSNPYVDGNTSVGNNSSSGNIAGEYIGFASPDVAPIIELRTQKEGADKNVDECLNLTKPSKFAESGVSKEKDREGKSTQLKDISDSMTRLIECTLFSIAKYLFINTAEREVELSTINVIPPTNFSIKSAAEVEAELFTNLLLKPDSLRFKQHKELLTKRFKEGDEVNLIDDIAFKYTGGLYLKTLEELKTLEGLQYISQNDAIKSIRAFSVIKEVLEGLDTIPDQPQLFSLIDAAMEVFLIQELTPTPPPTPPTPPQI